MGRLFWKFFFFFFLAQLASVVGVGVTIWVNNSHHDAASLGVEASPPAKSVVEAASATLNYGGVAALQSLLQEWQHRPMPPVYAVNEAGHELLQREISDTTVHAAIEMAASFKGETAAKHILANDGHSYVLFVPAFSERHAGAQTHEGRPDQAGDSEKWDIPTPPPEAGREPGPPPRSRPVHLFPLKPLLAGAFVSLMFAAFLAWYFSKPIKNLRAAFDEAASGRLDARVGNAMGGRRDELADLGRDFDAMATRLGSLLRGQTRLLHHVSHELRSPLARLQMAIGLARQSPEKIPSSLERIELESVRMDKLVGELLELSKLESGVVKIRKESVDVSELLASVLDDARFEADAKHVEVHAGVHAHFVLDGQPDLLHRAIENIVRNALKYSPASGYVTIEVSDDPVEKLMHLTISDEGPGVPKNELEAIFQPFFRGSTAKNGEGHGVGLAIAKQVVEAHGGRIVARNHPAGGLSVEISLPYASVSAASQNV
jgi:two-component system OmpR family sensor kinase